MPIELRYPGPVLTGIAAPTSVAEADSAYQLRYFANLQVADSCIKLVNAGVFVLR